MKRWNDRSSRRRARRHTRHAARHSRVWHSKDPSIPSSDLDFRLRAQGRRCTDCHGRAARAGTMASGSGLAVRRRGRGGRGRRPETTSLRSCSRARTSNVPLIFAGSRAPLWPLASDDWAFGLWPLGPSALRHSSPWPSHGGRAVRLSAGSPYLASPQSSRSSRPSPSCLLCTLGVLLPLESCVCPQGLGFRPDPIISACCHSPHAPGTVQNPIVAEDGWCRSRPAPTATLDFPLLPSSQLADIASQAHGGNLDPASPISAIDIHNHQPSPSVPTLILSPSVVRLPYP